MDPKVQRYIDAVKAGKGHEDAVRAAIPGVKDESSERFKYWLENVREMPGVAVATKPAKKSTAKKKTPAVKAVDVEVDNGDAE